jgi:hypothetical protein
MPNKLLQWRRMGINKILFLYQQYTPPLSSCSKQSHVVFKNFAPLYLSISISFYLTHTEQIRANLIVGGGQRSNVIPLFFLRRHVVTKQGA